MLVVFNDFQLYRNCDEEALGAFLAFVDAYKGRITHLVANGDILDFEQANRFAYTPDMADQAKAEIDAGRWLFEYLNKLCPLAYKVLVAGNHEARWEAMVANQTNGLEHWLKTPEEVFELKQNDWKYIRYGRGRFYQWHDWIFWHGARAGAKSNIPKLELEDAGNSGVSAHINRNMYWETRTVLGKPLRWIAHGGFSKDNLGFVKKANTGWSQGFGIYFWSKSTGVQPYSVLMDHGVPSFIWEGRRYSGKGFKIPI